MRTLVDFNINANLRRRHVTFSVFMRHSLHAWPRLTGFRREQTYAIYNQLRMGQRNMRESEYVRL